MNAILEQVKPAYTETVFEYYLRIVRENAAAKKSLRVQHVWGYTFRVSSRSNPGMWHTIELSSWYDLHGAICSNKWCKKESCEHRARAFYLVQLWMEQADQTGRMWAEREQRKVEFSRGQLKCENCNKKPIAHIDAHYCKDCVEVVDREAEEWFYSPDNRNYGR